MLANIGTHVGARRGPRETVIDRAGPIEWRSDVARGPAGTWRVPSGSAGRVVRRDWYGRPRLARTTVELRARPHHSPRRTLARGLFLLLIEDSGTEKTGKRSNLASAGSKLLRSRSLSEIPQQKSIRNRSLVRASGLW